jgi:hypothetical protein
MIEAPILVVIVLLVIATSEFTRGLIRKGSDLDSGRLATVQLIRQAKPDLTPLSTESTIAFCGSCGALSGKRDCVRKSGEKAARRALQRGRLSSTEVRPLPGEIAICRASLLEHAVLLRGVCERLPPAALSRDATENTCARFLWAILEGGELKLERNVASVNPSAPAPAAWRCSPRSAAPPNSFAHTQTSCCASRGTPGPIGRARRTNN